MKVAVVGGGISGLTAAWELSAVPSVDVTVHEASGRVGGLIRTTPFAGREVDEGADAFLRRVPDALRLCDEIGLGGLVSPAHGTACVWVDERLAPLPTGLVLGVPATFDGLAASEILSEAGLRRAEQEPEVAGAPLAGDASIGSVIRARYGDELANRIVGPLLGGIAAGDIDSMSIDAVTPQLAAAAHRSASLSAALRESLPAPGAPTEPIFAAPGGGMQELVDRLAAALRERGVRIVLDSPVDDLGDLDADSVVVTTPPRVTARLLSGRSPLAAAIVGAIPTASVVFTSLAFRRSDVPLDLDASGFLVPRDAGLSITAASWSSTKWERLAGDPVILRVSMGHIGDPEPIEWDDATILERLTRDLATTMGIDATPVDARISRYRDGFPQYTVGHLDRIDELEAALLLDAPDIAVCGMGHRGVGIPACIREARRAAASVLERGRP